MRGNIIALVAGVLFGLGLAVSQMTNPAKVLSFLDVAGAWDPSLAFVMGGAVLVMALSWPLQGRGRCASLVAGESRASLTDVDRPLVFGAALFGIGWGLVGYCPGPAVSALVLAGLEPLVFVLAMVAGMLVHDRLFQAKK
ncbi:MAG: YeeE/YedE family protein [Alcanivoracaceae bacterium]|jgi:hypothetical protein|nr:YeeE/YedE family protein [Alcanivoracaceae bacterium]